MKAKVFIPIIIIGFVVAFTYHFIAIAAIDAPHNESNNISCGKCHGQGLLQSPFWGGTMSYDELCQYCHTESSCPGTEYPEITGQLVKTHLDSDENPLAECRTCHNPHYQNLKFYKNTDADELFLAWGKLECIEPEDTNCPYDSDNNTTTLKYTELNYKSESGWDATKLRGKTNPCRKTILFPDLKRPGYSYLVEAIDEGLKTITVKGDARPVYQYLTTTSFAAIYGQFIRDNIEGVPVKFFDQTGVNSFADGDTTYNGVCEVCHTLTDHYRNDGGAPDQDHSNVCGADGTYCISCHSHVDGFVHGGNCEDCHGHEEGCPQSCSGTTTSHATHTENNDNDVKGPLLICSDCHDTNNYPRFYDGKDLSETDVCNPCHSPGGAFDGVGSYDPDNTNFEVENPNSVAYGAKYNWKYKEDETCIQGVYESDMLRSGKEKWCTGCHDDEAPTIPDPGGVTAKNVAGDNTTYGYFVSGHGKYNVSCTECHDPEMTHMDGHDRTYDASTIDKEDGGYPPYYDGIDGPRGYQQGYRLKDVEVDGLPIRPMYIPRLNPAHADYNQTWWADPNHFALCYSCHSEGRIKVSNMNNFVDLRDKDDIYKFHWATDADSCGHYAFTIDTRWDSDRRDDDRDSAFSCTTCHNPHGKDYQGKATFSMTRKDMGIVHKREVMQSYGYMESGEWENAGGDLDCFGCHVYGPAREYYYRLGTNPPEEPAFWTKLDSEQDVTDPTYGTGDTLLGGSFAIYNRYSDKSETGLYVVNPGTYALGEPLEGEPLEGCKFPSSNLNSDDEIYGETIDFWYTPNFSPFDHAGEDPPKQEYLFYNYYDDDNWIKIWVYNNRLRFWVNSNGTTYKLNTAAPELNGWPAGEAHNIVCTWGGAQGMHIYIDKLEPEYGNDTGKDKVFGLNEVPGSSFYIGNIGNGDPDPAGSYPALGTIDDFKIYGYQYQKFENGLAFFSKLGSLTEVENPVTGIGGTVKGDVNFSSTFDQHFGSSYFSSTHDGVLEFPTDNLNRTEDTIDLWYLPNFITTEQKHLFYCEKDANNYAFIKVLDNGKLRFTIWEDIDGDDTSEAHILRTTPLEGHPWYHIVCTWGLNGMHIYINDREASYEVEDGKYYYEGLWDLPDYFYIGNIAMDSIRHCDGYIDELRIYGYQSIPPFPY